TCGHPAYWRSSRLGRGSRGSRGCGRCYSMDSGGRQFRHGAGGTRIGATTQISEGQAMTSRSVLGVSAFALVCLGSAAAQEQRVCVLTGSQEVGGVVTNAIGCGRFVIDPVANTVDYYI